MTTPIADAHELFVHQLRTMLWVEQTLADDVLPELFAAVRSTGLRHDVEKHILETQGHARNVRYVLTTLREPSDPLASPTLPALREEHASLVASLPEGADALHDLAHADAIARTEHYEVAAYTGLVHLAKALDLEHGIVRRLRENLEQDAYALEQVEHAVSKLLAERVQSA